jgi:hypothetical protein
MLSLSVVFEIYAQEELEKSLDERSEIGPS